MRKLLILACLLLVGCTGGFQTLKLDINGWTTSGAINGVIFYGPQLTQITHTYTALADEKGNILGTAQEGKCRPTIQKEDLIVLPDFSQPYMIRYSPPLFSSGQFGVQFNNGLLTGVNGTVTSLPAEVLSSLVQQAESSAAAGTLPKLSHGGLGNSCNAEPVITSVKKAILK